MAKKEEQAITHIKKAVEEKKIVIGMDEVMKCINSKKVREVYAAVNVSKEMLDDISHACKLSNITFQQLPYANDELGTFCKKPFSISVLAVQP